MGASLPTLQVLSVMGSPMTSTDQVWDRPTLMVAVRRLSRTSRGLTKKNGGGKCQYLTVKILPSRFVDLRTIYRVDGFFFLFSPSAKCNKKVFFDR